MPGYQKLVNRYGSRGFAVVGFKFDTMMDTENPVLFAKKIGVRYPLDPNRTKPPQVRP